MTRTPELFFAYERIDTNTDVVSGTKPASLAFTDGALQQSSTCHSGEDKALKTTYRNIHLCRV